MGSEYSLTSGRTAAAAPKTKAGRIRQRRGREELVQDAQEIVEFINGRKRPVSGADIKKRYPNILGSPRDFVKKYAGVELKTQGERSQMVYLPQ